MKFTNSLQMKEINKDKKQNKEKEKIKSIIINRNYKKRRYHNKKKQQLTKEKDKKIESEHESSELTKYKQTINQKKKEKYITNETWGDEIGFSNQWPGITENNTIRLMLQNINGVSQFYNYIEWEYILNNLHEYQIDIAGFTEMNLDLRKTKIKTELYKKAKQMDQNIKMAMSLSPQRNENEAFKMGGQPLLQEEIGWEE